MKTKEQTKNIKCIKDPVSLKVQYEGHALIGLDDKVFELPG